jgi:hypothetical protein
MTKSKRPVLFLGTLPKKSDVVLEALEAAYKLLDSVVFVENEGDTLKPLELLTKAIAKVKRGK